MSEDLTPTTEDTTAVREPRDEADSPSLTKQLRLTIMDWHTHGRFTKLAEAQRIRACHHLQRNGTGTYGQPPHGVTQVFPWAGAPDTDSLLVDQIIREDVDINMLAWWMGQRSVRPRDVMDDEGHKKSEAWRNLLNFELDQTERRRADSLELFWNCMAETNCCVWDEGWVSQMRRGRKTMSFSDLLKSVQEQTEEDFEQAGQTLTPEYMDMQNAAVVAALYDTASTTEMIGWIQRVDPLIPEKEAKILLRAWRKGDQSDTPYFAPVPMPGYASPRALIPGIHCIWPVLTENHQTPKLTVFEWITGAEVLQRSKRENWDPEWTKNLLEHKGMVIDWSTLYQGTGYGGYGGYDGYALNGLDFSSSLDINALRNADLYQIAIDWDIGVDSDGLPSPYRTIYHGQFEGIAIRECDPHGTGKMSLIIFNREVKSSYSADFRGIAHHLNSHQVAEKQLTDGITAQALLRAGPPVIDTMDAGADGLMPFARMSGDSRSAARGGDFKFMAVPDVSPEVIEWTRDRRAHVDQLYLRGANVDPDAKRARRTRQLKRACLFYREMEHLLCNNARQDVRATGQLTLGSVGGVPINMIIMPDDLEGELDIQHTCDVSAMDLELMEKKIDLLSKILGFDRYGTTDFNKLYRILVGWVDPEISSAAITTLAQATDREKTETDDLIAKIGTGSIVIDDAVMKDAGNPQLRIARIQQWMQTPENVQTFGQRPLVVEQVQKLMAHYQFQIDQQKNAIIGRTAGVDPDLKNGPQQGAPQQVPMNLPEGYHGVVAASNPTQQAA